MAYYGSYLQGRATERSNLDFFFIPATDRGREVECQFVINGISFDFWPISWERAEGMAKSEEWNTTIIADCELLYVRSEEDRARFMKLREIIADMGSESRAPDLIGKAEAAMRDALINIAKMRISDRSRELTHCRILAQEVAEFVFKSLGFLNQTYYKRSWGHYREQVRNLPIKPEKLDDCLDAIMFSRSTDEILAACERLTADTLRLIRERMDGLKARRDYPGVFRGYYEEERGMLNKLLTACEKGHYETALFVAAGTQDWLARRLYAAETGRWPGVADLGEHRERYVALGYPDLVALLDPADFEPLKSAVLQLMDKLERHMREEGVPLNIFDSIAEFEAFYTRRI